MVSPPFIPPRMNSGCPSGVLCKKMTVRLDPDGGDGAVDEHFLSKSKVNANKQLKIRLLVVSLFVHPLQIAIIGSLKLLISILAVPSVPTLTVDSQSSIRLQYEPAGSPE